MSAAVVEEPRLIHAIPGRVRLHVPGWSGHGQRRVEARLCQVQGVMSAQANGLTGNILVRFDPAVIDAQGVLTAVRAADLDATGLPDDEPAPPPVLRERQGHVRRVRIPVRGLDRDPHLARRVVEYLERRPGVRAIANPLTGRVLVEYLEYAATLDDVLGDVAHMDLPDLPGEDWPAHPLDPALLVRSAARTIGAAIGLGFLTVRQLLGLEGAPVASPVPVQTSAVIGILQSFPIIRNGLRRLFGPTLADVLVYVPGIISQTLAGSSLGLTVTGVESFNILTEVRARRAAWRRYEERLSNAAPAQPGEVVRLETGERIPLTARIIEGTGTATGRDGLPLPVAPGDMVAAGARLYGGPFVVELQGETPFVPEPRPAPLAPSLYDRYVGVVGIASLAYAAVTALITRSFSRTFAALLLVNPRPAVIGMEAANTSASARVLRAGATVVGTRPERVLRRPTLVLLDGPQVLADGFELVSVVPLLKSAEASEVLARAAGIAAAAGSPWGNAFPAAGGIAATEGTFDGRIAAAYAGGVRYSLGPAQDHDPIPTAARLRHRGDYLLLLRSEREGQPLGMLVLRPRLAPGVADLVQTCQRHKVELGMLADGDPVAAQTVSRRAGVPLLAGADAVAVIRAWQQEGAFIAFVANNARAAAGFAACDLAIGLTSGRTRLPARADLLAPDLGALAAIIEAGVRREAVVRDSVMLSVVTNGVGAVWGFQGSPGVARASRVVYLGALGALGVGWARLRGGERPWASIANISDPRPERWGRQSIASVLRAMETTEVGLTSAQAVERRQAAAPRARRQTLLDAVLDQVRSPLIGILAAGAGLSLALGATADVAIIGATIVANVLVGAWQEYRAGAVTNALERMGSATARVLRDGQVVTVPKDAVVRGDVLLLAPGDRVAADARVLSAQNLEVDEAVLTGESLPVPKMPTGGTDASRIVLEGSDVTAGSGRAVVVAVGRDTRLGATAAALATQSETQQSPLGLRLSRLLGQTLPIAAIGGAIVTVSGLLQGLAATSQLAIGASVALTAVPEGLPLLTEVGEAAVARRLADQQALVRRLSAVEALGRVDVACTDKTGTLTRGRLALTLAATLDREATLPGDLPDDVCHVLLTAALASPRPGAQSAGAHPTDVAVIQAAQDAGLGDRLQVDRGAELPFDPARSFHATVAQGRLCIKGAPEVLIPRCAWVRRDGEDHPLDKTVRRELLADTRRLAERGLRVLMVAEGSPDTPVDNPHELIALGFVGISDPLRATVPPAVRRCRDAGVRVIMLTGDHPATARAIAGQAGLLEDGREVLTGADLAELHNGELDERLERAAVIARATPLDKLRIIESLQRRGHVVAMTGDGVNDAPALRLADVGVAMGRGGTDVARQNADVVLADDDFSTLVETFVEGRGFWRNIRRALALLLGGNLGELGLIVGASVIGLASPLTARQILAVNLITDVLPALAVALQQPEHRNLAALAREGTTALDASLRNDVLRRASATAASSLAAYLIALRSGTAPQARAVAFASIVATQLTQTLDVGWSEGTLTRSVLGAVSSSAGLLVASLTISPLRDFLTLATPAPLGWALIGAASLLAWLAGRGLALPALAGPAPAPRLAAPAGQAPRALPAPR
jgi:cation-transporting ATPase I